MLRFHAQKFRNYDLEDYDNFDVNATDAPRGRSNDRFKKPSSRRRQKSPCYQLEPPRRQLWRDISTGQERNFSEAPSIPKAQSVISIESMQTVNTSVWGSVLSITSSSSSSGARILPSEPSRSSSRNTMNGFQSPWTSTSSLIKRNHFFRLY